MGRIKTLLRNINYLSKHSLWEQREEDIVYLTNKILDDGIYEYKMNMETYDRIQVLSKEESLKLILREGKSFVRTGDGECKILMGMNQPFQTANSEIIQGLIKILQNKNENLLVAINGNYFTPLYELDNPFYYRRNAYDLRQVYAKYVDKSKTYLHAAVTGYQFGKEHTEQCIWQYETWHEAFRGKELIIVCGEGILDKLEYDVFDLAKSKKFIYGPKINAWDKHDALINEIKAVATKHELIVFILGMAGKVMISELTEQGYICWDVGHLAKFYNAYKKSEIMTEKEKKLFYAPD